MQKIKQISLDKNMGKDDNTFYLKSKTIVDRIIKEQSIHDVLRRNMLNEVYLFDTSNYSPMVYYK